MSTRIPKRGAIYYVQQAVPLAYLKHEEETRDATTAIVGSFGL